MVDSLELPMRLPVILTQRRGARYPAFSFPVNVWQEIDDRLLYQQALELNGVIVAGTVSFPEYFYKPSDGELEHRVRYVTADVYLDSTGLPTNIELVQSTSPQVTSQILAAMNWAEYRPLSVRGHHIPAIIRQTVFLYPSLTYPPPIWRVDALDTLNMFHRSRIQSAFDTIGLYHRPVPVSAHRGEVVLNKLEDRFTGVATVKIVIDTLGHATALSSLGISTAMRRATSSAVDQIEFLPALDFGGNPVSFQGYIDLSFSTSKIVRIRCRWLFPQEFKAAP
jgi:hypothetical protein